MVALAYAVLWVAQSGAGPTPPIAGPGDAKWYAVGDWWVRVDGVRRATRYAPRFTKSRALVPVNSGDELVVLDLTVRNVARGPAEPVTRSAAEGARVTEGRMFGLQTVVEGADRRLAVVASFDVRSAGLVAEEGAEGTILAESVPPLSTTTVVAVTALPKSSRPAFIRWERRIDGPGGGSPAPEGGVKVEVVANVPLPSPGR